MYAFNISDRPKVFINHDKNMPVFEGTNTELCCKSDSNPGIHFILWYKDSIYIKNSMNNICLFFKHLNRQDRGNYTCFAGNKIGNGSFATTLTVYCKSSLKLFHMSYF